MHILLAFGFVLFLLAIAFLLLALSFKEKKTAPSSDEVNALLPQTQCGHCGYKGCKPYAEAILQGEAINRCPPGGQKTADAIAQLLGVEPQTLDAAYRPPRFAFIREDECIGCTKCIQACPVDAILGAAQEMHTILQNECTGCDLCVEVCPVDCIEMRDKKETDNIDLIALISEKPHV